MNAKRCSFREKKTSVVSETCNRCCCCFFYDAKQILTGIENCVKYVMRVEFGELLLVNVTGVAWWMRTTESKREWEMLQLKFKWVTVECNRLNICIVCALICAINMVMMREHTARVWIAENNHVVLHPHTSKMHINVTELSCSRFHFVDFHNRQSNS